MDMRLFFAIDLSLDLKMKLHQFTTLLDRQITTTDIRWTLAEQLHITLQFLPSVKVEDLEPLINNVRVKLNEINSFFIEVGELEFFPSPDHPKILSMQINPQEQLAHLAEKIGEGIKDTNYPIQTRPFRGHITLGRFSNTKIHQQYYLQQPQPKLKKMEVTKISLFQSILKKNGPSQYVLLSEFML